jgi:exonuclease VII large subunit
VFDGQGTLVKDAAQLAPGDELSARLARGQVRARVTNTQRDAAEGGVSPKAGEQ